MSLRIAARRLSVSQRLAMRRVTRWLAENPGARTPVAVTASGAVASVVSHALITWLALFSPANTHPDASDDPLVSTRFLYPLMQPAPKPVQERISFVGIGSVKAVPRADPTTQNTALSSEEAPLVASVVDSTPSEPEQPYTELEVDLAAARDPESEGPTYPDSLLAAKIEGEARVRFVVDSTGRADTQSFAVLEANEVAFGQAVRLALPRMKFRPASIGPKRVSQTVEQTFLFRITRTAAVP
jgi:TonB family protein